MNDADIRRNDAPTTFAGLFAIAMMGVLMVAVSALVEQRMTKWAFRGEVLTQAESLL